MVFNNYEFSEVKEGSEVTLKEADMKKISDSLSEGKSVTDIKYELFIPTGLINKNIAEKRALETYVVSLMCGQVVESPAEYDENGKAVKEATYVKKPATLKSLKELALKKFPKYSILDYDVEKIVSNGTSKGTWEAFKECF